jgi:pimeloyl-ACP methyl ester carboxylesterase
VIGLNQRGHGGSSVGSEGFSVERLGRDLGLVLRALDLRDAIVVGHSLGGAAALTLASGPLAGADRIGGLVGVATLASSRRPDRNALLRLQFTGLFDRLKRDDHHAPALTRVVFGDTPPRVFVDDLLEMTRRCPTATATGAAKGMLSYDVRHALPSMTVGTTVVCGTRDLVTTHGENEAIAAAIPTADFVSVPGAGHMVIWEDPDAIVAAIVAQGSLIEGGRTFSAI